MTTFLVSIEERFPIQANSSQDAHRQLREMLEDGIDPEHITMETAEVINTS